MKQILLMASLIIISSMSFAKGKKSATRQPNQEAKATICYDEAEKYAATLASGDKVKKGSLAMFTNIGEVQVEGWLFPTDQGRTIIVVGSADGTDREQCRLNLLYNK